DGPLAVEAREGRVAPRLEGVHDDLRVAVRAEAVAERLQLGAQLEVVEDLAVERHPQRLVFVAERLLPGREVDDREARVGETGPRVAVDTELIRAAVVQRPGHGAELA